MHGNPPAEFRFETDVLPAELQDIRERRITLDLPVPPSPPKPQPVDPPLSVGDVPPSDVPPAVPEAGEATPQPSAEAARLDSLKECYRATHEMRPLGLAFSGGGIRSATLNLGILQGLAEIKLLPWVDYLSTVSGGGYIGSWFHGVVKNLSNGNPCRASDEILSPRENPLPDAPDKDPVTFLRKYSNYLAPRPGALSADSWVIGIIWLRNVLLNQLILVPALAAVVLLLIGAGAIEQMPLPVWDFIDAGFNLVAAILAVATLGAATVIMCLNLRGIVARMGRSREAEHAEPTDHAVERWSPLVVALVFCAALLIGCSGLDRSTPWSWIVLAAGLLALFALFQWAGGFFECYVNMRKDPFTGLAPSGTREKAFLHSLWMSPVSAALTWGLIFAVWQWTAHRADAWQKIGFAPPLICISMSAGVSLLIGLMGVDYPDAAREWLARIGSLVLLLCAGWAGLYAIAIFGPWAAELLFARSRAALVGLGGGWIGATVTAVLAGKSAQTGGQSNGQSGPSTLDRVLSFAPAVFMVGYLLLISFGVHQALNAVFQQPGSVVVESAPPSQTAAASDLMTKRYFEVLRFVHYGWDPQERAPAYGDEWGRFGWVLLYGLGCAIVTLVASSRININEFSLHHFYKNRLVRCYLGASRTKKRDANPLTGFDPNDDFALSSLVPSHTHSDRPYCGPYALVNTALNLNAGSELATQERKATSFFFSPRFCGFQSVASDEDEHQRSVASGFTVSGYCRTRGYALPEGPALGTVTAISGAAANPNSGFHTSGSLAFLLTVFDARLGSWLGNPRWESARKKPGPAFALKYLFAELFGQTDARSKFVNLSDGGHFDNLGLYELVRRRCRFIIIGDGEEDGELTFGSLGQAIRMCRADFGVEIDINPTPIRRVDRFSRTHCVVGTIRYPEQETGTASGIVMEGQPQPGGPAVGWLLYLKSSLTGDEPADVIEYQSRFPEFPHQSTADQFFSESQFESYRRLGLHILRDTFEDIFPNGCFEGASLQDVTETFQKLTRKWYAPLPVTDEAATRLTAAYTALVRRLTERPDYAPLAAVLLPNQPQSGDSIKGVAFVLGLEALQLMEDVFTEFKLQHYANRANPRNAGWMGLFERWCRSDAFYHDVWETAQGDYNLLFRQFVKDLHNGRSYDVLPAF